MEMNENDLILGCDPSLNSSGLCILDYKGKIVHTESFNPSPLIGYDRLSYNYDRYNVLLNNFKNIKYIGFERQLPQQRYNYNAKNILDLAENIGILKLVIQKLNRPITVYEFLATEIKKFATGNSKAEKSDMESVLGTRVINNIKSNTIEYSVNDVVDAYHAARITLDAISKSDTSHITYNNSTSKEVQSNNEQDSKDEF